MKKLFLWIISILLILSLTACGSKSEDNSENRSVTSENPQSSNENVQTEIPSDEISGKKVLVVYFSATGNTKTVAECIASETGGDLFEIIPTEPYSSEDLNWNDKNSRVVYEHEHPDDRNVALVKTSVDNFDEYDTVFIGYPIWWGIAAWPVNGFIEANDFTGKTVVPFCTSTSSDLGNSGNLLKETAKTGNWLDGKRFSSGASETEIAEWIKTIGN